ncbi:proteophosphoglycan ppg4 [Ceratobasidium sp. AG-Ba]|nr:proteophosphoglycan ppg4 [Ceratobasidium sp. AG-Ba]
MQADNRLLTNLIKCEKEHHSALLALLVRSHTSLAALSAYASTAAPPVAQALLGCIQAFAAADEGLRGYAAALEGWKEELKEVKRVEDEVKTVMRDKELLVGRLIKASKQKIPTSSLQAGPAPIPNASYLSPASPSSSSFSLPNTSQPYGGYTPTPHATQHINSKLALAQRELHACEAHLAGKEAELAEVRRSAMTEGMARRCRAMADVGLVWRERGDQGLGALEQLGRENAGAPPPPPPHTYNPPRRSGSYSSHSGSSLSPSHSASQYLPRSQSPFGLPRSTSPFHTGQGTYQTLGGGYQHSHALPALPERDSWHAERPATYHQGSDDRRYDERDRRPMSMVLADDHRIPTEDRQRPVSSLELRLTEPVALDIPPPHSIGDHDHVDFVLLGRPVSSMGHHTGGSGSGQNSRWGDDSSSDGEGPDYQVVENEPWTQGGSGVGGEDVDPEILKAVEKMGMVPPPKPRAKKQPPTPPATASPTSSPNHLPDVRVIEATPQKPDREKRRKKKKDGALLTDKGKSVRSVPPPAPIPVPGAPKPSPAPTSTAAAPIPGARPMSMATVPVPAPMPTPTAAAVSSPRVASPAPASARVASPAPAVMSTSTTTAPAPQPVHAVAPSVSPPRPVSPELEDATLTLGAPTVDVSVTGLGRDKAVAGVGPDLALDSESELDQSSHARGLESDSIRHLESDAAHHLESDSCRNIESETTRHHPDLEPTSGPEIETTPKPELAPIRLADDNDDLDSAFDNETEPTVAVLDTPRAKPVPVSLDTPKASAQQLGLETPKAAPMATLTSPVASSTPRSAVKPPAPVRVPTPVSNKAKKSQHRMTSSTTDPLVRNPTHSRSASKGAVESASETEKKTKKKKKTRPTPAREPSAEDRADLAAMLRDSDGSAPHVHFPAPGGGMYVPTAPPVPKPSGGMYLPSTGGGAGTTRSDVGPARSNHFDLVPPSPVTSAGRGRSGSGSTGFFGRVAGLFGRKKNSGDSFGRDAGAAWKTRTDAHIRGRTEDSSDDDRMPANLVTVTNVHTPSGRLGAVDNHPPGSPKPGVGRRLTKADRGQTLRVGPPPESPKRTRKASLTDRDERFEPATSPKSKKTKGKKAGSQSVDGGGLSRKGSLKSTISEPVESGRGSSDFGGRGGRKKAAGAANLMALVEDPGSSVALAPPSVIGARRSDSPARAQSPQSLLSVPPTRAVSPTSTAAPKPVRATSPMPLKSALRRTPSPMPQGPPPAPIQVASPTLVAPSPVIASASPRNSIAESVYETGEEDFDDASDGEGGKSDVTAAGRGPSPVPPTPTLPTSPGAALAAFKSTVTAPLSDTAASVSTAGPYSANGTQPARRKSVRINPDPPEMSATPDGTPAVELDEEPKWENKKSSSGGWSSRIGRGWEDSSEESGEDEEYERVRKALESSYKHMDAVSGVQARGKEKSRR